MNWILLALGAGAQVLANDKWSLQMELVNLYVLFVYLKRTVTSLQQQHYTCIGHVQLKTYQGKHKKVTGLVLVVIRWCRGVCCQVPGNKQHLLLFENGSMK